MTRPADDEHDVVKTCRELKIKINAQKGICVSRWSFTKKNLECCFVQRFHLATAAFGLL